LPLLKFQPSYNGFFFIFTLVSITQKNLYNLQLKVHGKTEKRIVITALNFVLDGKTRKLFLNMFKNKI